MGEYGLEIKNVKACTLDGFNKGIRDRYDFKKAMFNNSLFSNFICKNGLKSYKDKSTRDIICFTFDFGSRDYEEEKGRLNDLSKKCESEESKKTISQLLEKVEMNKDKFIKMSKEEIRDDFYINNVNITYEKPHKKDEEIKHYTICYKMLYRSSAKAKLGQVMFINEELYDKAYDWITMGLGNKMPLDNAKIVEMSAYTPLTTSTIIDTLNIDVNNIVILKDKDSEFITNANIVKSKEYEVDVKVLNEEKTEKNRLKAIALGRYKEDGSLKYNKSFKKVKEIRKKCVVEKKQTKVKNTIWDGMGLIDESICPKEDGLMNGMLLLRNHFFKMCGFRTNIQLFFKDWCKENNKDYNIYQIEDMFGVKHCLKDIKVITTDNAIKWKKFMDLMGNTPLEAYEYWCKRIIEDGCMFGVVKTDHESKLGKYQQMSYQMINTLPCTERDIKKLSKETVDYVELIKSDDDEFEKFLRKNKNEINHYEMMADLYNHNHDFANSKWFRREKTKIILNYVDRLRKGKIFVNADNLTICGNPYGLLLYCVGDDYKKDDTIVKENGAIQCYTKRFNHNEYLCAFRNPHNSPNNVMYLHNIISYKMDRYFNFSQNIIAVNCIETDIQDRANSMDFDSDFVFATNNEVAVKCAKECYNNYPTIVNDLKESGVTYQNTKKSYSDMDNKFANARSGIGTSSNLAMLALTYYWTELHKEIPNKVKLEQLYDNFVILSVLAQVIIDGCKREYEVDALKEIDRIRNMDCMNLTQTKIINGKEKKVLYDLPKFMKYTKEPKYTKDGKERDYEEVKKDKEKIRQRINPSLICPMNRLEEVLDNIKRIPNSNCIDTKEFFIKMNGRTDARKISKIREMVEEYDNFIKNNHVPIEDDEKIEYYNQIKKMFEKLIERCSKIKTNNLITYNRLIETSLGIDKNSNQYSKRGDNSRMCRKMLNTLYNINSDKFLSNFF